MRRIDGPGITAEVLENPFNDRRRLDAGDDAQTASAEQVRELICGDAVG